MSFRSHTSRTVTLNVSANEARTAVVTAMQWWHHTRWQETPRGYEFWFYGDLVNGASGRFIIQPAQSDRATTVVLELESHAEFGGRAEGILNKFGLARQCGVMLAEIRTLADPASGHQRAVGA